MIEERPSQWTVPFVVEKRNIKVKTKEKAGLDRRTSHPEGPIVYYLVLAHWIEREIREGRMGSLAEAARMFHITRARMTQIVDLVGLSVERQEGILVGKSG
jgi:hypothetical protein